MVIRHGCENVVANTSLAKLISARWQTFDGDEKRAALRHPLGNGVRQFFTDGPGHGKMILKFVVEKSP
jgi:hypothetical protein